MASVARVAANADRLSVSGIDEARPGVRVSTTDCATSGNVSSLASAAAAAAKAGTPGVTVIGNIERFEPPQLFAERTPDRQVAGMQTRDILAFVGRLACISAMISSSDIGAVSMMRAPGGQ